MAKYRVSIKGKNYEAMADLVRRHHLSIAGHSVEKLARGAYSVQAFADGPQIKTLGRAMSSASSRMQIGPEKNGKPKSYARAKQTQQLVRFPSSLISISTWVSMPSRRRCWPRISPPRRFHDDHLPATQDVGGAAVPRLKDCQRRGIGSVRDLLSRRHSRARMGKRRYPHQFRATTHQRLSIA
jgi:hypothetical protein